MREFGQENSKKAKLCNTRLWTQAAVLCALLLAFTACSGSDDQSSRNEADENYVYVLEMMDLENTAGLSPYDVKIFGESLYCTRPDIGGETGENRRLLCEYSLTDQRVVREFVLEGGEGSPESLQVLADGSVFLLDSGNYVPDTSKILLKKYDSQGKLEWQVDMGTLGIPFGANGMAVDSDGRVYLMAGDRIVLLEANGSLYGEVSLQQKNINLNVGMVMGPGRDGKVYVGGAASDTSGESDWVLAEICFEEQRLGELREGSVYNNSSSALIPGADCDFLISDGRILYGYSLEEQAAKEILSWKACEISGSSVYSYYAASEDRILVYLGEDTGQIEVGALIRKDPAAIPQKTELELGVLGNALGVEDAVADYNRHSNSVHVTVREYNTGNSAAELENAKTQLYLDILSGKGPDLLELTNISMDTLAANGSLEDLAPYLAQSSVLEQEDYLENVLEAYTFGGKLLSIPRYVSISTLAGPAADLGEEPGWTIEELMAYVEAHPDARLYEPLNKATFLSICLKFGKDTYIDWTTNTCYFDADKFKQLLNFTNSHFPQEFGVYDFDTQIERIKQGQLLLLDVKIDSFDAGQPYAEMYDGDITFIGYPTADGSNGASLDSLFCAYSILATSEHKEEAWSFVEYYLGRGEVYDSKWGDLNYYKLPTNRKALEVCLQKLSEVTYKTYVNGELVLDSDGNPMIQESGRSWSYNNWRFEGHRVTEEEAAVVMNLLETGKFASYTDPTISNIIYEETQAYFLGQKSLDETAELIQRRVQLYLDEIK